MRMGDLLESRVADADGRDLGVVHDVRLVQDGPLLEGFGHALRVDGLVVGPGSWAVRLGYLRHGVKGPWLVKALAQAVERRTRFVPWGDVEAWDGRHVRLRCREADLRRLAEIV